MERKSPRSADPNVNASRVVAEATASADALPANLEQAWADWSRRFKDVDQRTMTLLRAAFVAGAAAASFLHGRKGGLKGGQARAAKLSKERRSDIAKKAATTRWGSRNQDTPA